MMHKAWRSIEEVPYWFSSLLIKFDGHTGWIIKNLNPIWVTSRPVAALKPLRLALLYSKLLNWHKWVIDNQVYAEMIPVH